MSSFPAKLHAREPDSQSLLCFQVRQQLRHQPTYCN